MKVLHVIDEAGTGGAESVFIDIVTNISKEYKPVVVIGGVGWLNDQLVKRGIKPIIIDAKGSINIKYLIRLLKIIRKYKINLIHAHLLGSSVYCSLAGLLLGVPVISTFHGVIDVAPDERFRWLKMNIINIGSKKIVAVSEYLKRQLIEQNALSEKKMKVVYNGLDFKHLEIHSNKDLRSEIDAEQEEVIIGAVGNINSAKGYEYFVNAISMVSKQNYKIKVVIAGEGRPDREQELKRQIDALGLNRVIYLLGFRDDVFKILNGIDIFVLPSISEGFSIATIEAMSCKKPVIVTESGGPEEIVTNDYNGILIKTGSEGDLADGIIRVLEGKYPETMIENAYKTVQNRFTLANMIHAYENIYRELLV